MVTRKFSTVGIALPSNVKNYAVTCSTSIKNPPKRRDFVPPTTTTISTSKRSKTIPTTISNKSSNIYSTIPPAKVSSLTYHGYCENSTSCFREHTKFVKSSVSGYYSSYTYCDVFTHNGSEPTPTGDFPITSYTSYCQPTHSTYISGTSGIIDNYGTTITDGDYITDIIYNIRTTYSTTYTTTYCMKPTSTITTTITTKPTKTIKTTTTTTTTTSTTTTTTTTTPITKTAKCIPVVITVTEKEKTTITENETITVTVTEDDDSNVTPISKEEDDSECAGKWGQCGGIDFKGPKCCKSGLTCHELNNYYSQCY